VILLISPWLFAAEQVPTWTAVIGGAVITATALAAFTRLLEWEEWVNLVAGLCIAASPEVLGFTGLARAAWTHIIVGAPVARRHRAVADPGRSAPCTARMIVLLPWLAGSG
jgi:SPW repeat